MINSINIMKKIKNILVLLISVIILKTTEVKCLNVIVDADGNSIPIYLPACYNNNGVGCGYLSQNFVVRATVVDGNNVRVRGTKTIVLHPQDTTYGAEYLNGPAYGENDPYSDKCDNFISCPETNSFTLQKNDWQNALITGSTITKQYLEDYTTDNVDGKNDGYEINMGAFFQENDFSTHESFRYYLIASIENFRVPQIYIPEIDTGISVLDFILKETGFNEFLGYPDEWRVTRKREIMEKIHGQNYRIILEPIYEMNLNYNGYEHTIRGTAKEVARVIRNSLMDESGEDIFWFWPAYEPTHMYNLFCNFVDESGTFDKLGEGYRCDSVDYFDPIKSLIRDAAQAVYDTNYYCAKYGKNSMACKENKKKQDAAIKRIRSNIQSKDKILEIYRYLADPNSAYGVNVIRLDEDILDAPGGMPQAEEYTNKCEYTISTCTNNDFEYKAELTSSEGDIFDCIYPSEKNKMSADDLKGFSVQYENSNLWCYDDVTYSFKPLSYFDTLNGGAIKANKFITIPTGTLTVTRTCFTKDRLNGNPGDDNSMVFGTNDDGAYQDEFVLTLNNQTYKYKRGNKYQGAKTNNFDVTESEETSKYGEKYYKYTSTFQYDYDIDKGTNMNSISINIKNQNVSTSLGTPNAIDYKNEVYNKGKLILTKQIEDETYYNTLSTTNEILEEKLNNAYGYSNTLYNTLKNEPSDVEETETEKKTTWKKEIAHDEDYYTFKNEYTMTETNGNKCAFTTQGKIDITKFRVISLSNPFPGRDGSSRMPGTNWITQNENNVYEYIQNNRNIQNGKSDPVSPENIYTEKEPLYTVTLDATSMIKIREYNKRHSYSEPDIVCENGTGRKCISYFLRNDEYIKVLDGTCGAEEVNWQDTSKFYTCADKTEKSGG